MHVRRAQPAEGRGVHHVRYVRYCPLPSLSVTVHYWQVCTTFSRKRNATLAAGARAAAASGRATAHRVASVATGPRGGGTRPGRGRGSPLHAAPTMLQGLKLLKQKLAPQHAKGHFARDASRPASKAARAAGAATIARDDPSGVAKDMRKAWGELAGKAAKVAKFADAP